MGPCETCRFRSDSEPTMYTLGDRPLNVCNNEDHAQPGLLYCLDDCEHHIAKEAGAGE